MKKIRAAVVGYGNIGHYALQALEASPDFEVAGIVRRNGAENKPEELARYDVVKDIRELQDVDVAFWLPRPVAWRSTPKKFLHSASIQWTVSTSTPKSLPFAARSTKAQKREKPYPSSPQGGIRVATPSYAPCYRLLPPKASPTRISDRA